MEGSALPLAAFLAIAGIAVLRWSWSLSGRSAMANAAGLALLTASIVAGAMAGGAWGIAVASLFAMGAAFVPLGWAAATTGGNGSAASVRRVRMLPERGEPLRLGGRAATFAITVPLALVSSIAFAAALRILLSASGLGEADANASALIAAPLVWSILAAVLLMQERRSAQLATLALVALPLLPALLLGS